MMVFNSMRGTTYLFGGTVPDGHRPTARPSSGSTCPTRRQRPNGAGLHGRDGGELHVGQLRRRRLLRADRRAVHRHLQVVQRRRASAGHVQQRPRRAARRHLSVATRRATPTQQCKKRLGQACNIVHRVRERQLRRRRLLRHRLQRHAASSATWPAKRGTCSFVPSGDEDPVGAPACVSEPDQGRFCDGAGNCSNTAKANGKPCTAGGQCTSSYCIDGFCCNSACAQTCYQCDKAGRGRDLFGDRRRPAGPERDHAVRHVDAVLQRLRARALTNKKPNGETVHRGRRLRQQQLRRRHLLQRHVHGHLPVVRGGGLARQLRQPAGRARRTRMATTPCSGAVSTATRPGPARRALKPNGSVCAAAAECGSDKCVDGVCCDSDLHRGLLHLQPPGGTPGECVGLRDRDDATPPARAPNYCDADAQLHDAARSRTARVCAGDIECASNACVDGTCCESACTGKCRSCKNATGTCAMAGRRHGSARWSARASGVCSGRATARAPAAGVRRGRVSRGRLPERPASSRGAGKCDGAGNCVAPQTDRTATASAATRTRPTHGEVQDGLLDGSRVRASSATARSRRRRRR